MEEDEGVTPSLPVATLKLPSGCCADADGGERVPSEMQGITVYSHTLSLKRDTRPSREMQGFAFLHLLGPLLRMWFGVMGGPMWGRQHRWSVSKPNLGPLSHAPSSQPTDTGLW